MIIKYQILTNSGQYFAFDTEFVNGNNISQLNNFLRSEPIGLPGIPPNKYFNVFYEFFYDLDSKNKNKTIKLKDFIIIMEKIID